MPTARVVELSEYRKQRAEERAREAQPAAAVAAPVAMPVYAPVLGGTPWNPFWMWVPVLLVTAG